MKNEPDKFCTETWIRQPGALSLYIQEKGGTLFLQSQDKPLWYCLQIFINYNHIHWSVKPTLSCVFEQSKSFCLDALIIFEHDYIHKNLKPPQESPIWETQHSLKQCCRYIHYACIFLCPNMEWISHKTNKINTYRRGRRQSKRDR